MSLNALKGSLINLKEPKRASLFGGGWWWVVVDGGGGGGII